MAHGGIVCRNPLSEVARGLSGKHAVPGLTGVTRLLPLLPRPHLRQDSGSPSAHHSLNIVPASPQPPSLATPSDTSKNNFALGGDTCGFKPRLCTLLAVGSARDCSSLHLRSPLSCGFYRIIMLVMQIDLPLKAVMVHERDREEGRRAREQQALRRLVSTSSACVCERVCKLSLV